MSGHLRRNAVAYLALFVALSGTSYAAIRLPAGSVGSKQLKAGAVTNSKLARNAVTSSRVKDRSLRGIDFARGELPAGPTGAKGDPGVKGDTGTPGMQGVQGPPGPTLGVAGLDTGCCPSETPTAAATASATKTVTLQTRARLFVVGSTFASIQNCPAFCTLSWGLRVDGVAVGGSLRLLETTSTVRQTLSPFGVTDVLEPGTHTLELVVEPTTGSPPSTGFGRQHIAAIALGV